MAGDQADDRAVELTLSGQKEAFRAIVDRYGARILSFCRARLRSEEEARDAAQEVFVHAYRSLARFRLGESFPAWLFAIAANHARTRYRLFASDRHKVEAAGSELAASAASDPAEEAVQAIRAQALRRAVAALPKEQRAPVELYYFGELSVEETARALGIGEEAVKSRLFRARKALRIALEANTEAPLEAEQPETGSRGIVR
ncbi:MAG TPA: sigma-70 family RNA polymerase sigma factor [Rectinemataceae bacterium]